MTVISQLHVGVALWFFGFHRRPCGEGLFQPFLGQTRLVKNALKNTTCKKRVKKRRKFHKYFCSSFVQFASIDKIILCYVLVPSFSGSFSSLASTGIASFFSTGLSLATTPFPFFTERRTVSIPVSI